MSKNRSAHIFRVEHRESQEPTKPFDKTELENPESAKALMLMQSRLMLTNPKDNKSESLEIEEVETFPEIGPRYRKAFDSKPREPNSLFIPVYRGTRLVTMVVDPQKKSVILLKSVSSKNHPSRSAWAHLQRVFGKQADSLDGQIVGGAESNVELMPKKSDSQLLRVAVTTRSQVEAVGQRERLTDILIPKA